MEQENFKININQGPSIFSEKVSSKIFRKLIENKKIKDEIFYKEKLYIITGATSFDGICHKDVEKRDRYHFPRRKKKLLVASKFLDRKTNQIFLKEKSLEK